MKGFLRRLAIDLYVPTVFVAWIMAGVYVRPDGPAELAGAALLTAAAQSEAIFLAYLLRSAGRRHAVDSRMVLLAVMIQGGLAIYACAIDAILSWMGRDVSEDCLYVGFLLIGAAVNTFAYILFDD